MLVIDQIDELLAGHGDDAPHQRELRPKASEDGQIRVDRRHHQPDPMTLADLDEVGDVVWIVDAANAVIVPVRDDVFVLARVPGDVGRPVDWVRWVDSPAARTHRIDECPDEGCPAARRRDEHIRRFGSLGDAGEARRVDGGAPPAASWLAIMFAGDHPTVRFHGRLDP